MTDERVLVRELSRLSSITRKINSAWETEIGPLPPGA